MRLLVFAILMTLVHGAQAETPPLPRPKPEIKAMVAIAPLPRAKPSLTEETEAAALPGTGDILEKLQESKDAGQWPKAELVRAREECASLLSGLDIIWRPDTPIGAEGGCGTPMPIAVAEIAGVRISPVATMNCPMAAALHRWLSDTLKPAARKNMGARLTEITNASSYACRRRNNAKTGKLSEHAKANAFDVSEFRFDKGGKINVKGDYLGLLQSVGLSGRGNFLRAARAGACAEFNTVLGPGSDAFHKDHFHVDLMPLRPGRHKLCR